MAPPRIRPRFELVAPCSSEEALDRLRAALDAGDAPCTGQIAGAHVHLRIAPGQRRLWSPFLSLEVNRQGGDTVLRGHFGPHPDVWTFFVALYAVLAFGGVVGLLFGLSQWMLRTSPVALWAVPASLALAAVLYGLALVGQRLGHPQLQLLRTFVETATGAV